MLVVAGSGVRKRLVWPQAIQWKDDHRLMGLLAANRGWKERWPAERLVVDAVCLVESEAAFFEAIGLWDDRFFFPILLAEDPELALRFVGAFRPRRLIFWEGGAASGEASRKQRALEAVARSWVRGEPARPEAADGLGPTRPGAPGVVLTASGSPTLPGAVALAAGHVQPILFHDDGLAASEVLSLAEALALNRLVERFVYATKLDYVDLGDACDFLTIACDWPDRYVVSEGAYAGESALDDLLGRQGPNRDRYAYTGRLLGTPAQSVYQAMCSLFLQPDRILLFNGYSESSALWGDYRMSEAAEVLGAGRGVEHRVGPERASLEGWREAFGGWNRFGLVLVNSSGSPDRFSVRGGKGETRDIPWGAPVAAMVTHSYSAARPQDIDTLAGRWIANGAFLYFGAMNEPYLQAFRTPGLIAELLSEGVPVGAAVYRTNGEDSFSAPWRLRLIGDPLYRLLPARERPGRVERFAPLEERAGPRGLGGAVEEGVAGDVGGWFREALQVTARGGVPSVREGWVRGLLELTPPLGGSERAIYDALLAWVLVASEPTPKEALTRVRAERARSAVLRRAWEWFERRGRR